jgi:hypothetical protein
MHTKFLVEKPCRNTARVRCWCKGGDDIKMDSRKIIDEDANLYFITTENFLTS